MVRLRNNTYKVHTQSGSSFTWGSYFYIPTLGTMNGQDTNSDISGQRAGYVGI